MLYGIMCSVNILEKTMPWWEYVDIIHVATSSRFSMHCNRLLCLHKVGRSSLHAIKMKKMLSKPQNNLVVIVGFLCYNGGTNNLHDKPQTLFYTLGHVYCENKTLILNHISFKQKLCKKIVPSRVPCKRVNHPPSRVSLHLWNIEKI